MNNLGCACRMCGEKNTVIVHSDKFIEKQWNLMHCKSCKLHFLFPFPTEDDLMQIYSSDSYHSELLDVSVDSDIMTSKYKKYYDTISIEKKSGTILDVGCATGLLVKMFADKGYESVGLEIDKKTAVWGSKTYGVNIINTDIFRSNIPNNTFDVVILGDIVEHNIDPYQFMLKIHDILKDDGVVLVSFPDIASIESLYWYKVSKLFNRPWLWKSCHIPAHIWEFTKNSANLLFRRTGFEVVSFNRYHEESEKLSFSLLGLIELPIWLLLKIVPEKFFGTQMVYLLRKSERNIF